MKARAMMDLHPTSKAWEGSGWPRTNISKEKMNAQAYSIWQ